MTEARASIVARSSLEGAVQKLSAELTRQLNMILESANDGSIPASITSSVEVGGGVRLYLLLQFPPRGAAA